MTVNRQILLASRPVGLPEESNFRLLEAQVVDPAPGQILVRIVYLSVDPYMRGRMSEAKSYAKPVGIGEVMVGSAVGRVVASRHPHFEIGNFVEGPFGWQEYALSDGTGVRRVDPALAPVSTALGVLGMPGLTAYFGLLEICDPKPGETVVVSGAAGAVGSLVGQIAKIKGCRVVGIAGSDDKVRWLTDDLGFDAAFNYKMVSDYAGKLKELCPGGVDVYFDNVGGSITDAVFTRLNNRARVSVCGQISRYNADSDLGPRLFGLILTRQIKVEGFLVYRWIDRSNEGIAQMAHWLAERKLIYREQFTEGIESAPGAFIGMLGGANTGKQLVRVSEA